MFGRYLILGVVFRLVNCSPLKYRYIGCYVDKGDRAMKGYEQYGMKGLTTEQCAEMCGVKGFMYSGTEVGQECFCGNDYARWGKAPEHSCSTRCGGNKAQQCGGGWRVSVHATTVKKTNYVYKGCFRDNGNRALKRFEKFNMKYLTTELCGDICRAKGYQYAGTEVGRECFCGDDGYARYGKVSDKECSSRCNGNRNQMCGGGWRVSVHATNVKGVKASKYRYIGCYVDSGDRAMIGYQQYNMKDLTTERCAEICDAKGFMYSGTEVGRECFCGDDYARWGKAPEHSCSSRCGGNKAQRCGGGWKVSVHATTVKKSNYKYKGCFVDSGDRAMKGFEQFSMKYLTTELCGDICRSKGYQYSGTQIGQECFCGNDGYDKYGKVSDNQCSIRCKGNHNQMCGGGWRLSVHATNVKAPVALGKWTKWTRWSACSKKHGGVQQRVRECAYPNECSGRLIKCTGKSAEAKICNQVVCPKNPSRPTAFTECKEIKCESKKDDFHSCKLPAKKITHMEVLENYGHVACSMHEDTCGVHNGMLWVDVGCSGRFKICYLK